jgi:hypothetical protein
MIYLLKSEYLSYLDRSGCVHAVKIRTQLSPNDRYIFSPKFDSTQRP